MTDTSSRTRKEQIWRNMERESGNDRSSIRWGTRLAAAIFNCVYRVLKPWAELRIGLPYDQTMGRFYGNTEYYLRLRAFRPPEKREIVRFVCHERVVNSQILKMLKRRIVSYQSDRLRNLAERVRARMPDHPAWIDLGNTGWLRGDEWYQPGPQLSFSKAEDARGKALLKELGVREGQAHVCIFAKDRFYSDNPENPPDQSGFWANNDFRNCDIETFIPAAEYLAEQDIMVFRMGVHPPETTLPEGLHPNIVDYTARIRPTLDDADFADTYLQATCKFFVGCTSGIYILSAMFGRPIASTNMVPYGECGRNLEDVFLVKNCRDRSSGNLIPFRTLIDMGLDSDWLTQQELEEMDRNGLEFVDNCPEQILQLVREINLRADGEWVGLPEDDELDRKYRMICPTKCFDGAPFPGKVSAAFLRKHRELLH